MNERLTAPEALDRLGALVDAFGQAADVEAFVAITRALGLRSDEAGARIPRGELQGGGDGGVPR